MLHRGMLLLIAAVGCGRSGFDPQRPDAREFPGFCLTATFSNPPASSLVDDFTTPYTDRWTPINPVAPCINQVGSELVATPSGTMPLYCYAFTLVDYHLTCDSIFMKVPEVTSAVLRVQTLIYATSLTDNASFNVLYEAGGLQMGSTNETLVSAPYESINDVWWRLTERDGEATFDTSPDGLAWRELMRTPTTISLDHVQVSIGAGTYADVPPTPGQARFRCFNKPPPCN